GTNGINDVYWGQGDVIANSGWLSTKAHDVGFHITGTVGTDQNGKNTTWQGGSGTGAGTTGHFIIQTSTPTTSGTATQAFAIRLDIGGDVTASNGARYFDVLSVAGGYQLNLTNSVQSSGGATAGSFASGANAGLGFFGNNFVVTSGGLFTGRINTSQAALGFV